MMSRAIADLYQRGIAGCLERDGAAVREVLLELVGALNFDYEQAARELGRLYDAALRQVDGGHFEAPLRTFRILHETATVVTAAPAVPRRPAGSN